jgi:Fe-Mn family superoxide dismutase
VRIIFLNTPHNIMQTRRSAIQTIATSAAVLAAGNLFGQAPAAAPAAPAVHKLPPLGYEFDALEPIIDAQTMEIHHDKHHKAYVDKLNDAIAKAPELAKKTVEELITDLASIPEAVRGAVRNQGGGHYNHSLFWKHLKKGSSGPEGDLLKAIEADFGSFAKWQELFTAAAVGQFGSGWAWLVLRKGKLAIEATANQDSPLSTGGAPLLGVDVWEHAYYLKYKNVRPEYVKAFQKVIDWKFVGDRYAASAK